MCIFSKIFLNIINFLYFFVLKMSIEFLRRVKELEDINLCISVDPEFRRLHDKFNRHPTEKHYAKLIAYLCNVVDENKVNFLDKFVLGYADDDDKLAFNSSLKDNLNGNSLQNYLEDKIPFDNRYQN